MHALFILSFSMFSPESEHDGAFEAPLCGYQPLDSFQMSANPCRRQNGSFDAVGRDRHIGLGDLLGVELDRSRLRHAAQRARNHRESTNHQQKMLFHRALPASPFPAHAFIGYPPGSILIHLPSLPKVQGPPSSENSTFDVVRVGDSSTMVQRYLKDFPPSLESHTKVQVFPARVPV
jgi:hypothetical protein